MKSFFVLLMLLGSLQLFAKTTNECIQEDNPVNIELNKGKVSDDDTHPRTLIPIQCIYVDGAIQLALFTDLGDFTLIVTNQITSEQWSAVNTLALPTSNATGTYLVQIVTEDGNMYWGIYTL